MAFKSEAQRAKFAELVKTGKMKQETFDKWQSETPKDAKLPERIHPTGIDKLKVKIAKVIK